MTTKTISITSEAYNVLKSKKEYLESFSAVIVRLCGKKNLSSFYGVLGDKSGDDLKESIASARRIHRNLHIKRINR